ncbi:diguanylate cyclase [Clostridiales bacterium COT073_COT-073]|nr:diguanylate cyclase [Clostridiales bacterium COT073_COT-073]
MEQIMALVSKASVLLAFVFISAFISEKLDVEHKKSLRYHQVAQGIIFSIFIFIDIKNPFISRNGISYDAREVLLNLSAAIYGPLTATITAAATFVMRWARGTLGTGIALINITVIYLIELTFLYIFNRKKIQFNSKHLFLMAALTNITSGLTVLIIGGSQWRQSIVPALTVFFAYPVFTVEAFRIMKYIRNREELLAELSKRDKILFQKNQQLQHANEELHRNELHFRTMFYHSSEAVFLMEKDEISDLNLAAMQLLGYGKKEDVLGKSLYLFMPEMQKDEQNSQQYIENTFRKLEKGQALQTEIALLTKNGVELLLEGVFIEIEMTDKKYVYMSARDIRERKKQEEEMMYKAQYDALTQVANRQYFSEMLKKICSQENNYPVAFIMADINGLKLTNDLFGHSKGDELIVKISQVLNKSCRNHDLIARVGGDEFIIIFPKANEKTMKTVIERIRENLSRERVETVSPSLAMGYAIKEKMESETDGILHQADERMYIDKLDNRQKNARIFLGNIMEKLYEVSPADKKQCQDLKAFFSKEDVCADMSPACKKEVEKLIEYVNIGKLITHQDDWPMLGENVKNLRFSQKLIENSYSVLRNIGEIESMTIAEHLISLNESWDGSGFVLGTAGEEIPLAVRGFRILFDAYYMQKHPEIFGQLSKQQILEEMQKQAGKKYDPILFAKFAGEMKMETNEEKIE